VVVTVVCALAVATAVVSVAPTAGAAGPPAPAVLTSTVAGGGGVTPAASGLAQPRADFEWSPREPEVGETVTFDARPATDDVGLVAYRWDLDGDGLDELETERPVITHSYGTAGTYRVRLTVEDNRGETDVTRRNVTVTPPVRRPRARCSLSTTETTVGETVTVDASATENATELTFAFGGDGADVSVTETGPRVRTVEYGTPGRYTVAVRAVRGDLADRVTCGAVDVLSNDPPTVTLTAPATVATDQTLTLTATAEDDGTVAGYRWDLDGDGTVERTTETGTVEHAYGSVGDYEPTVTVTDGAGATTTATAAVSVRPRPTAACSLSATTVGVGESFTVDASASEAASGLRVDRDGDGTVERTVDGLTTTLSYDQPGEYRPRVVVVGAGNTTDAADCGPVSAFADATTTAAPTTPTATTAATTAGETTTAADGEAGGGLPLDPPWPLVIGAVALGAVLVPVLVSRVRGAGSQADPEDPDSGAAADDGGPDGLTFDPDAAGDAEDATGVGSEPVLGGAGAPETVTVPGAVEHTVGSVELPAEGGEVVVDDVGFAPDAAWLTATSRGATGESAWSHGLVAATEDDPEQVVVAVGDADAGAVTGTARTGAVLDLPVGEGETDGVAGTVALDADGFRLSLSSGATDGEGETGAGERGEADAGDDATAGRLWYHALSLPSAASVEVGRFDLDRSGEYQSVPLSVDADYATLTAVREGGTDAPVALSHGVVADDREHMFGEAAETAPPQWAVGSAVDAIGRSSFGGGADRAVHLPTPGAETDGGDDPGAETTTVRARSLARTLDLAVEERTAETCAVAYLAVDLDGTAPTVGVATPGAEGTRVPTATSLVGGVGNGAVGDDAERSVPGGLPQLGWSHGVAGLGRTGPESHVLPPTAATTDETPALVRVPAIDDDGRIVGRATVGVRFETDGVRLVRVEAPREARAARVFYAAWPDGE
jgi:PKD repeat protein